MTTAKGLSSGYAPIACTMTTRKVADAFATDKKNTFGHGITFGTHPVSCAVALRNVEILEEEGLVENSARTGQYLLEQLREMQSHHPTVGDVRGIGLMLQVELVKDRATKEPFTRDDDMQTKVGDRLIARGLLCRAGNSISVAPPLIANREDADEIVDIIDATLGEVEEELALA
jgi:adenosylmethionine-8-amino-7-oxononanoate aminotransferase